ncbi:MAG: energy-dependent translational throttle protein EttA [Bacteroidetes bacterium HGW-Bacteroidetes-8]|jgi:ATP-binding cassette ChvD family protein|nr:MAG: energy-dependent translational throttle protein EttA [Bacteroidetes bacterium HGW-Bacteroidetes-8]
MADEKIIFSMNGVGKILPNNNKAILKDIYLSFFYGAKIGIIGLNGSGKSTLLKIIAGVEKSYQGDVVWAPGYSVGFLEQEPQLDDTKTVIEIVKEGAHEVVDLLKQYEEVNAKFMEPMDDDEMSRLIEIQGELTDKIEHLNGWDIDSKLEKAMDALQCPDPDALVKHLSGGERRRIALCRLLLKEPDVLLLDEPTNHLDTESIQWLEAHLQQYKGTVIAVTHDRYFLDNVAGWILELDRGEGIPWKGNYSSWLDQKSTRLAQEEKQESKRRKTLERELEWVRMSPKARHAKSKARLGAYEKLLNEDGRAKEERLEMFIPNGPRLGDKVIEAVGVTKAYGERVLFEDLNFKLPPAGIVGVIGPNGAGKTTLFRLIMGIEKCDEGLFTVGESVKTAYVDQQHKHINPDITVYESISQNSEFVKLGNREMNARAYVSRFNFSGADQEKLCGILSGGERNRLHLALTLKEEANVLLLDEPTNDVDVNTIRALEEGLENFAGCAVIISHDRWFLDRIATHILAFEGDSKVYFFEGSYSEYEENKKRRLGDITPKRFKYKKLTR